MCPLITCACDMSEITRFAGAEERSCGIRDIEEEDWWVIASGEGQLACVGPGRAPSSTTHIVCFSLISHAHACCSLF